MQALASDNGHVGWKRFAGCGCHWPKPIGFHYFPAVINSSLAVMKTWRDYRCVPTGQAHWLVQWPNGPKLNEGYMPHRVRLFRNWCEVLYVSWDVHLLRWRFAKANGIDLFMFVFVWITIPVLLIYHIIMCIIGVLGSCPVCDAICSISNWIWHVMKTPCWN